MPNNRKTQIQESFNSRISSDQIIFAENIPFSNQKSKNSIKKREETIKLEDSTEPKLVLKIRTNSTSPIYEDFWGWKFVEEIHEGAFDEALNKDLFSFMDHKIDIANTIASTKNKTMTFTKEDYGYKAEIILNKNDPLHMKLYDLVKEGIITANSFIFKAQEAKYQELLPEDTINGEEVDYKIIYTKGDLISVDPVVLAFYTQNDMEAKKQGDKMPKIKREDTNDKTTPEETIEEEVVVKVEEEVVEPEEQQETNKEEVIEPDPKSEEVKEVEEQLETSADRESKEDTPKQETPPPEVDKDGNSIDGKTESKDPDKNEEKSSTTKDLTFKITIQEKQEILNKRKNANNKTLSPEEIIEKRKNPELNKKNKIGATMPNNTYQPQTLKSIQEHLFKRKIPDFVSQRNILNEDQQKTIEDKFDFYQKNFPSFQKELEMVSRAGIDAATYTSGIAYFSYINDPEVYRELVAAIPEIEGARVLPLENLDIVKKDIMISSGVAAQALAEGAEAQFFKSKTFSIEFKPTRYHLETSVNPLLANAQETMESQSDDANTSIITTLRKTFDTNVWENEDNFFATIEDGKYNGGITKDSLVSTLDPTKLQLQDLNVVVNNLNSKYGNKTADKFKILMHPETLSFLQDKATNLFNASWVFNPEGDRYKGIKIITSPYFKYKVKQDGTADAGTKPIIFLRSDSIYVRGLNFNMEDSNIVAMRTAQATRFITCRGEYKLLDPYINTITLNIGAITGRAFALRAQSAKSIEELNTLKTETEETITTIETALADTNISNEDKKTKKKELKQAKSALALVEKQIKNFNK